MKTKIITLSAMLLMGFSSIFAGNPDGDKTKMEAREDISLRIDYPEFAIEQDMEGTVYVRLELLENGQVNVIKANSPSNELLRYVVDNLETMHFDPEVYATGEPFNMKFSFVLY